MHDGNVALLARAKFHSTKIQKRSNPHNLSISATAAVDVSCRTSVLPLFFAMQLNQFCLPLPYELERRKGKGGGR